MNTNTQPEREGFLLLFSGKDWDVGLSREELQRTMDRFTSWSDGLVKSGKVKDGQALGKDRTVVSRRDGRIIADGPFAESKEAVGGYMYLQVETLEEALEIAESCPGLDFGGSIEIRAILSECPSIQRVKERLGKKTDPVLA